MLLIFKITAIIYVFTGLSYAEDLEEESRVATIFQNCEIEDELSAKFESIKSNSEYGTVDYQTDEFITMVKENCQFTSENKETLAIDDLLKTLRPFIKKGRLKSFNDGLEKLRKYKKLKKCEINISTINAVKSLAKENGFSFPQDLKENSIDQILKIQINKFGENIDECFSDYIYHLECNDGATYTLSTLRSTKSKRSIKSEATEAIRSLKMNCKRDQDKQMLNVVEEIIKEDITDSLYAEYERLEHVLSEKMGREDHRPIVSQMQKVADDLKSSQLQERTAMLHLKHHFPSIEAVHDYQLKRKRTCTNIDNTNSFVKMDQSQGDSNACFSFGAANLMNYHLGIQGISPLYLFTLSIVEQDSPWYVIEENWRRLLKKPDSISSYHGGFPSGAIEQAIKRGVYCSTDDLIDIGPDTDDLKEIIENTEEAAADIQEALLKMKQKEITDFKAKETIDNAFEVILKYFPKAKKGKFIEIAQRVKRPKEFFSTFLLSQCKTPFPHNADKMKIKARYDFSNLTKVSIGEIDRLIENDNIAAIGVQSKFLLSGEIDDSWSPHIVTLTGRRWNNEKSRCEYRIINSWGEACDGIENLEVSCDPEENQLWLSESQIEKYGNSITSISDSPMIKAKRDPNFDYPDN